MLTDNNHDISRVGWNDAFGEFVEFQIVNRDIFDDLFGYSNYLTNYASKIKTMANSLISMLPDPADKFINLIYTYHRRRYSMPCNEWRIEHSRFLKYFLPCNGGFEFDHEITIRRINKISLDTKTCEGKSVKLGIRNLGFVQAIADNMNLYMTFQIMVKPGSINRLDMWTTFANIYCKFSL